MLASRKPSKRHSVAVLAPADHAHPFRNLISPARRLGTFHAGKKGRIPHPVTSRRLCPILCLSPSLPTYAEVFCTARKPH